MDSSNVERDEDVNVQEKAMASSKPTNPKIASLLNTFTALIQRLVPSAMANANPSPLKQRKAEDNDSEAEVDMNRVNTSQERRFKYLRRQRPSCILPLACLVRSTTGQRNPG